jgi:hypothetical protein
MSHKGGASTLPGAAAAAAAISTSLGGIRFAVGDSAVAAVAAEMDALRANGIRFAAYE